MKLNELTILEARAGLDSKKFTAVELVQACLDRIKERDQEINAFITVTDELALKQATQADEIIAQGAQSPLTGIPFAVKDAICTAGIRSTASAKILDNYIPPYNATVIQKILDQGAVLIGKTNCDSFGHGASNENSMYGAVANPFDITKVAGGSSGGSAAAVADNMCLFSIAEDTGGSIRQPAAFCGIVGLRPSYGRNSRFGIMPMASSFDTVGPMTKTVEDMAVVMKVIAGQDALDATTLPAEVPDYLEYLKEDISGLRVGVPREYFENENLDPEIKQTIEKQIKNLESQGAKIVNVSLPFTKYAVAAYYVLVPSEDSSNLGRMDGVRYGVRADAGNLFDLYAQSREQGFPEEVKRRILIGTYALSAGYYDAYYKKAQQVRTLIRRDFDRVFSEVDVLITPTSPFAAFNIGEKSSDPLQMYLADIFVSPATSAGIPGISVNAGFNSGGLPIGVQIMGPCLGEGLVMRVANKIKI